MYLQVEERQASRAIRRVSHESDHGGVSLPWFEFFVVGGSEGESINHYIHENAVTHSSKDSMSRCLEDHRSSITAEDPQDHFHSL